MVTLTEVFRRYGPAYLAKYASRMPKAHRRVMEMILRCRTGELGYALYRCEDCGRRHTLARSCGNRHCPTCQWHKTQQWLAKQVERRLPCPYFLITFTVPPELKRVIRSHQRAAYEALFQSAVDALRKLAA